MSSTADKSNLGKRLGRMAFGGVVGLLSVVLFMSLGKPFVPLANPAAMLTVGAGLVYVLIGLSVGVGAASPRVGAHFLNVEDSDELREQRVTLAYASASCVLAGLCLLILALSAPGAERPLLTAKVAALPAALCIVPALWAGVRSVARSDELMRQVSREASAFALHVSILLFGGWAALAHFGFVPWMGPLILISGFALLHLLAAFWISGKKGMLKPR